MLNFDGLKKVINTETAYEDFYNDNNELAASRKLSENGDVENQIIYYKNSRKAEMLADTVYGRQYWYYYNRKGILVFKKTISKDGRVESKGKFKKNGWYRLENYKENTSAEYNKYIYYFDNNDNMYMQKYFLDTRLVQARIVKDGEILFTFNNLNLSKDESEWYLIITEKCLKNLFAQRKRKDKAEDVNIMSI